MKVKTYRAATLREALDKVKRELGPDAFILGQREVRSKNLLGLSKARVEVTAAIEVPQSVAPSSLLEPSRKLSERGLASPEAIDKIRDRLHISRETAVTAKPASTADNQIVLDEIRKLNAAIRSISPDRQASVVWLKPRRFSNATAKELYAKLVACGIEERLAGSLTAGESVSMDAIATTLAGRIRLYPNLIPQAAPDRPAVIAFVGPTGVGKTTTIAKLAAHAAFNSHLKVGLVTLDNFRIAAVEQLKTYGEIMGMSVNAAAGVRELNAAIQAFSDRDVILVDTAGRNHREISQEWELAAFLNASEHIKKTLVVSATTCQADLADIVDQYDVFSPDCLIFTKLDETRVRGTVINELVRSAKPLAYVTVGQGVPQDIVKPEARQLVDLTVGTRSEQLWTNLIQTTRGPATPAPSRDKRTRR